MAFGDSGPTPQPVPAKGDEMSTKLKLGFVGLGIMGAPMAGHLVNAGHQVFINTRTKVPADLASSKAGAH